METNRRIVLENTFNTRDLSGYKIGRELVTSDRFLRSDHFSVLSSGDADTLKKMGVRTIIDLRSSNEVFRIPSIFTETEEICYCRMPVFSDEKQFEIMQSFNGSFVMSDFYIAIIELCGDALRDIFRKIASKPDGKIMYNCSAGKDRTGILSAMLLKLAGVKDDDIVYDYTLTELLLKDKLESMKSEAGKQSSYPECVIDELMSARAENMEVFLDYLEKKFNGIENYLKNTGLEKDELAVIKEMMIAGY